MANCKSSLVVVHHKVRLDIEEDVYATLMTILDVDSDLFHEDYLSEEALELGYETEAEYIVRTEMAKTNDLTYASFRRLARRISKYISDQDFFGACHLSIIRLDDKTLAMSWVVGGI